MKRHNRIEKAIIMSLLLSSSIYGVASAEEYLEYSKEGSIIISAGNGDRCITTTKGDIILNATDKIIYNNNKIANIRLDAKNRIFYLVINRVYI